jgi:hypothetical protein
MPKCSTLLLAVFSHIGLDGLTAVNPPNDPVVIFIRGVNAILNTSDAPVPNWKRGKVYALIHVDDIGLIGSTVDLLTQVKVGLSKTFVIDLTELLLYIRQDILCH